jgi:prolyl-tRNA editing enzyme YbaK/EbsC (Cys-tRNA(Pro) deacylase)
VHAYAVKQVRALLDAHFELVELSTFPTLSSLLPNTIFKSEKARQLCTIVDRELRFNEDIAGGPYVVAICRKRGKAASEPEPFGYSNVMRLMKAHNILPNIKDHAPVRSLDEAAAALGANRREMVKTILVRITEHVDPAAPVQPRYYAIAVQAHRKLDFSKVADVLKVKRRQIDMATLEELEDQTGFTIGGIPPFGYPRSVNVIFDERVRQLEMVYCGVGKRTESLRIAMTDLIKLAAPVFADVADLSED